MKPHRAMVYLGGALVAACAPTYSLTVQTNPQGARLVEQGSGAQFISPAVLTYELTARQRRSDGCFYVRPVVAHWTSGAAAGPSEPISLCGNYASWTLTIERPAGAPGLEQDLAAAQNRERELEVAQINQEIARLEMQALAASSWQRAGYGIGCAIAGGCPESRPSGFGTGPAGYSSPLPSPYQSPPMAPALDSSYFGNRPQLAPNGTYVGGPPRICPNGTYVGGSRCTMAPDGSYVGGRPQLAPNGTYVGGAPRICPDGTYVGGSRCVMAPDGGYVGAP
jgi:hypothetical protein